MSSEEERTFGQYDFRMIIDLASEPSYISEIARKLRSQNMPKGYNEGELKDVEVIKNTWNNVSENTAVRHVASIVNLLMRSDNSGFDRVRVGYDSEERTGEGVSQSKGSRKLSFGGEGVVETEEWEKYSIIYREDSNLDKVGEYFVEDGWAPIANRLKDAIDPNVTVDEKVDIIKTISRIGNDASYNVEKVVQSVMERQFRYYDTLEFGDYNDPGPDFYVEDEDKRDYGLVVEVSNRWVNPIGNPYLSSKKSFANNKDADLLILAPRFVRSLLVEYENPDDDWWHRDPLKQTVHLHRVPNKSPDVYRPFAKSPKEEVEDVTGNPIIIPDNERTRNRLSNGGRVSGDYPVVGDDWVGDNSAFDSVLRDTNSIPESKYRNQVREALEPVLPNFLRPYKVEQFLIDFYWDKGLTQTDIGKLIDRSGRTIGEWMSDEKWNIITRGTGAPELSDETVEIWRRMYLGLEPFVDSDGNSIEHSGYRIQAEYNRHPYWGLSDWDEWYSETDEDERLSTMVQSDSFRSNIDYTILLGPSDRLQPSYSFIMSTLKRSGVDIRESDRAPRVPYRAYSNRNTIEYMINRGVGTFEEDTDGAQTVTQADVEVFDSYLEVDVADWLNDNKIPFAHEPFTIPSLYGPNRMRWEKMVSTIRLQGENPTERYDFEGTDVLGTWAEIYDKHRLQEETVTIPIIESLRGFAKNFVLPDLVLYPSDVGTDDKSIDWEGWDKWTHIIEVSGLYGVGIPEDANEEEWFDWYRVAGVAFKELAYRLLGIWDDVYFIVPNQPKIEGVQSGIPRELRDDPHYVIFNSSSAGADLSELAVEIGLSKEIVDGGLSPPIEPTEYDRERDGINVDNVREYEFDGIVMENLDNNSDTFAVDDDWIVFAGGLGEVYITDGSVHVRSSQWEDENMLILREYVLESLRQLSDDGIIDGLREI